VRQPSRHTLRARTQVFVHTCVSNLRAVVALMGRGSSPRGKRVSEEEG
jgi:hypothetical protein